MSADQRPPVDIEPIGCGFQLYCGFDDWFVGMGGALVMLVIGALLVKRWRDIPTVGLVTYLGTIATSYLVGAPALKFFTPDWISFATALALLSAIATAIAAAIHALKRLTLHIFRPKPA